MSDREGAMKAWGVLPGNAHTDSDRPAWGDVFAKASESAGPKNAAARIRVLVTYLQTLQARA
jgi:hypothetical protein